jgi:hypothetical protein
MATTYPCEIVSSADGRIPPIVYDLLEANSQTFDAGELVYSNSGAITQVADDGQTVLGIALVDATNTTTDNIEIPVQIIRPGDVVRMRLTNNGTAALSSAATLYTAYGLDGTPATATEVDVSDTSNDCVTVVKKCLDEYGSADYWVEVTFLEATLQHATGA